MVITHDELLKDLSNYSNKNNKINRDVKAGYLFKVITGLYETDSKTPGYLLAGSIYGPSYISFEYALSIYGLIPERVNTVTCACFGKKKKKIYKTDFGIFTYRDIPPLAYPEELIMTIEGDYSYQIATPEKALCDKFYTLRPLGNYKNLEEMLFNDLRIDKEEFDKLDYNVVEKLSELYHSTNVCLLARYMKRNANE